VQASNSKRAIRPYKLLSSKRALGRERVDGSRDEARGAEKSGDNIIKVRWGSVRWEGEFCKKKKVKRSRSQTQGT